MKSTKEKKAILKKSLEKESPESLYARLKKNSNNKVLEEQTAQEFINILKNKQ